MILRDQKSWSGRSATERLFWTTDNSIELASRSTDWVAREWSLFVFSTSHSFTPLLRIHYVLSPSLLIVFIIYSLHNAHRICIMSSSVHPTSCYNFLILSNLARCFFSLPFRINTSIPQFYFVIIFDQQIHLLTHPFMFSFYVFLSHLFHVRPLSIDSGSGFY